MKKCLFAVAAVLLVVAGCGSGGGGGKEYHIALCNNGKLSDKNSCTEACDEQGGVKQWLVENCGPNP